MPQARRGPMYYLVCAACLIALIAIEYSQETTLVTLLAMLFYSATLLRYLYFALLSALFRSDPNDTVAE